MKTQKHFWQVVGICFLTPIIFAIWDLFGAYMWRLIGGWEGEAYTTAMWTYQTFVWGFAGVAILLIALVYYATTRDKSESLAVLMIPLTLLAFGAEDVWFYFLGGFQIWTDTMPWLTGTQIPTTLMMKLFGLTVITGPILLLTAGIGYLISYLMARQLVQVKG